MIALRRAGVLGALTLTLGGCGTHTFASESPRQILSKSLRVDEQAASVRIVGRSAAAGAGGPRETIDVSRNGAEGVITVRGVRTQARLIGPFEYVRITAASGARLLDTRIPNRFTFGWVRVPLSSRLPVTNLLLPYRSPSAVFDRVMGDPLAGYRKQGVVSTSAGRAIQLSDQLEGTAVEIALRGQPYAVALRSRFYGALTFSGWNAQPRVRPPARWISLARLRRQELRVHALSASNATVNSAASAGDARRFSASGIGVQFDYPADFVPLQVTASRGTGSGHVVQAAVGLGSDLGILVLQFSGLRVPVNRANVAVLAPEFTRAVGALAKRKLDVRVGTADGYPLLSFTPFVRDGNTERVFNLFFGDDEVDLQCVYSSAEQTAGLAACRQMTHTLRVVR